MSTQTVAVIGGMVADGLGAPLSPADLRLQGGRIVDVVPRHDDQPTQLPADRIVDASGLVVAPGFIDIHTHSDVILLREPAGASKILQGVTTEVIGNCSFSAYPVSAERRGTLADHLARLGDGAPDILWADLPGYEAALSERSLAINVIPLVGHGALRIAAMDNPDGPAADPDVELMKRLLDQALSDGAWGFTTGLTHTPSSCGPPEEVCELVGVVAAHDAMYATHARATAGHEFGAITEALDATRRTGARLQFSHLAINDPKTWGKSQEVLAFFDGARAEGLDVAFDVYPYDASSSSLVQYLPEWAQEGGSQGLRRNGSDPRWRARVLAEMEQGWYGGIPWLWDRVLLVDVGDRRDLVGLTLQEAAQRESTDPRQLVLDLCVELGSEVMVVMFYRTESDMMDFLSHPLACVGSDGNALPIDHGPGKPHPRAFGTFPRVLGRYARDHGLLTLPEAIRRMTSLPASRLGLADRGVVKVGAAADLVIFDPRHIGDRATFQEPRQAPTGIHHTIVGGELVVHDGRITGRSPGRVLLRA